MHTMIDLWCIRCLERGLFTLIELFWCQIWTLSIGPNCAKDTFGEFLRRTFNHPKFSIKLFYLSCLMHFGPILRVQIWHQKSSINVNSPRYKLQNKIHRYLERGLKTAIQTFSIEVWYLKNIKTPRKESWRPNFTKKA